MVWHTFKIDIKKDDYGYIAIIYPRHKTNNCHHLSISFHELYDEGYDDNDIHYKDFHLIFNGKRVGTIPYDAKYNIDIKTLSSGNYYQDYMKVSI
jgi:hypothetical protein